MVDQKLDKINNTKMTIKDLFRIFQVYYSSFHYIVDIFYSFVKILKKTSGFF
jgi:hypothetical protein